MKIFYSWQSDLPNSINRGFIEAALKKAVKAIASDDSIDIVPVIDRDTAGVAGSKDIGQTILKKIEECEVFVADVTIINSADTGRKTPNPNVLFELGYALRSVGDGRIILVQNTTFGPPEELPFDLRMKKVITYAIDKDTEEKAPERNTLYKKLEGELRIMVPEVMAGLKEATTSPIEEVLKIMHLPEQKMRLHQIYANITSDVCTKFESVDAEELKSQFSQEKLVERVKVYEERVQPLEDLFVVAGRWGEQVHENILAECMTRIVNPKEPMQWVDGWLKLRRYPALRLLYSGGLAAVAADNYRMLMALTDQPKVWHHNKQEPFLKHVNLHGVMEKEVGNLLPGMANRYSPLSDYLFASMREVAKSVIPDDRLYEQHFDRLEYLLSLLYADLRLKGEFGWFWTPVGRYGWRQRNLPEAVFQEAQSAGERWQPLLAGFFSGSFDRYLEVKKAVDEHLARLNWY